MPLCIFTSLYLNLVLLVSCTCLSEHIHSQGHYPTYSIRSEWSTFRTTKSVKTLFIEVALRLLAMHDRFNLALKTVVDSLKLCTVWSKIRPRLRYGQSISFPIDLRRLSAWKSTSQYRANVGVFGTKSASRHVLKFVVDIAAQNVYHPPLLLLGVRGQLTVALV